MIGQQGAYAAACALQAMLWVYSQQSAAGCLSLALSPSSERRMQKRKTFALLTGSASFRADGGYGRPKKGTEQDFSLAD